MEYEYDEETGKVEKNPSTGEPLRRLSSEWAPCRRYAAGKRDKLGPCPKGTPEEQNSLLPENAEAYRHYKECQAVGNFPDDPLVRRHADVIRSIEQGYERHLDELRLTRAMAATIGKK